MNEELCNDIVLQADLVAFLTKCDCLCLLIIPFWSPVQWAGKTIALGTFPLAEADEKCAKAKALTRAWRSSMRPKPSREWVMLELERLQVRVVSGRLGRKEGEKDSSDDVSDASENDGEVVKKKTDEPPKGERKAKKLKKSKKEMSSDSDDDSEKLGKHGSSINASLLDAANSERGGSNKLTDKNFSKTAQRRNSSLGLALSLSANATVGNNIRESLAASNEGSSAGESSGFGGQSNRPYVGGASASAYEAARADYYRIQSEKKETGNSANHRDTSDSKPPQGLGDMSTGFNFVGSSAMGSSLPQLGLSVNPNQHYEMLKLHHMNLLNEIQETTLMMNLYQQQQLQQQKALQSSEVNMELQQLAERQQLLAMQQLHSLQFPHSTGNMLGVGVGLGTGYGMSLNPSQVNLHQTQQFNTGMLSDAIGGNRLPRRLSLEQTEALFTESEIEKQEKRLQVMKEELARRRDNRGDGK